MTGSTVSIKESVSGGKTASIKIPRSPMKLIKILVRGGGGGGFTEKFLIYILNEEVNKFINKRLNHV